MRIVRMLLVSLLFAPTSRAQPTTLPATVQGMLMNGAIRYDVPADWKEVQRGEDGKLVSYVLAEHDGLVMIYVSPTDAPVDQSVEMKRRMAKIISEGTENGLKKEGNQVIRPPTLEKDDLYFMRLRSTYQLKDAHTPTEQLAIYRPVGLSLASVTVTATTDSKTRVDDAFKLGEKVLDSVRTGKPIRPSGFPRARVWITPPLEWTEAKTDTPAGLLVTYRDPRDPAALVRINVRPMTREAKADTGVRQTIIDALLAERDKQLEADGLTTHVDLPPATDAKYLQHVSSDYVGKTGTRRVETRVLLSGDTLLAVTSVAPAERAAPVIKVTDALIESIKPIERK